MIQTFLLSTFLLGIPTIDQVPSGTTLAVQEDVVIPAEKLDLLFQRGEAINNPRDQYDNSMGCYITMKTVSSKTRVLTAGTEILISAVEVDRKPKKEFYTLAFQHPEVASIDCWKSISTEDTWTPMTVYDFSWTFGDYFSELPDGL